MKHIAAILFCIFTTSLFAQDAKVIALDPADAAKAKALFEEKARVEKGIADLQNKIQDAYVSHDEETVNYGISCPMFIYTGAPCLAKKDDKPAKRPMIRALNDGWKLGFVYSDDFKFIVPKPQPFPLVTPPCSETWSVMPATGCCGSFIGSSLLNYSTH